MIERITGFQIVKRNDDSVRIDYLEKGRCITTEELAMVDNKSLESIQKNLMSNIIMNLGLAKSWTESKKITMRNTALWVTNMFRINIINSTKMAKDIEVIFIKNGYLETSAIFNEVTDKQIDRIREILVDNTEWNLTCRHQCEAISYLDMLVILEQIKEEK